MSLFMSSPKERILVLSSLVERQLMSMSGQRLTRAPSTTSSTSSAPSAASRQSDMQVLLLSRYFETMAESSSIVSLLSVIGDGTGADNDGSVALKRLMVSGVTLLVQYTESAVLDVLHSDPKTLTSSQHTPSYVAHLKEFLVRGRVPSVM